MLFRAYHGVQIHIPSMEGSGQWCPTRFEPLATVKRERSIRLPSAYLTSERDMVPKRLIDWFGKNIARWIGTCTACGEIYVHRGTEPTQSRCTKRDCNGTIIWQLDEI